MDTFPLSSVHQHIDPLSSEIIYLQGNMPAFEKLILGYGRTVEGIGEVLPQDTGFWFLFMGDGYGLSFISRLNSGDGPVVKGSSTKY